MNGDKHGGRRPGVESQGFSNSNAIEVPPAAAARRMPARPLVWGLVAVALVVWSLLAWGVYALADGLVGWGAANAGAAIEGGKGLATAAGVGKPVGDAVNALNLGGLAGQGLDGLRALLGPAIIILWLIGAGVLVAIPWLMSRLGALLATRSR